MVYEYNYTSIYNYVHVGIIMVQQDTAGKTWGICGTIIVEIHCIWTNCIFKRELQSEAGLK